MDPATVAAWRQWAEDAPSWAFQFFGGDLEGRSLEPLVHRHGPIGAIDELVEAAEDRGTRITVIIEPEGEW